MKLTPREKQIIFLICEGKRNKEISEIVHQTPGAVQTMLYRIYCKIGVHNRVLLTRWYLEHKDNL